MNCPSEDRLQSFVEGQLEAEALLELTSHLEQCSVCRCVLGATLPRQAVHLFGDRLHVAHATSAEAIVAALVAGGHRAVVRPIEPSLEDAYVRLVSGAES